jgi:hypothetical protein
MNPAALAFRLVDRSPPRLLNRLLATLVVSLLLLAHGAVSAAGTSRGKDFWLMFNANYNTSPTLTLFIAGDTATTGTVSVPGIAFSANFSVTPGAVTSVNVPASAQVTALDSITNQGVRVTANADVSVYGLNRIPQTTDEFLALPIDILGTEHLVIAYAGGGSQLGVVGTQANTVVTITPRAASGSRPAGVPYAITLGAGQTYQLRTSTDMTGTVISSTKPISVFGSNQCVNVPTGYAYCDHLVEQLPPATTWGKAFLSMPLATRTRGDTFRILASEDNTVVSVNGSAVATLNRGAFHERIITGAAQITATQPVLVAQFSNGTTYDGVTSDPFMMLIPPYEQFLAGYTVTTPASGFATNFINLVVPTAAVGSLLLDGVAVPASAFAPIGTSGFSGSQRPVALGTHTLSSPLPFGAFMYGFADYDSYGYPGGYALAQVAEVSSVTLAPRTGYGLVGDPACVNAAVKDQNGAAVPNVRVDFTVTGVNPRSGFSTADATGVAAYCYTGTAVGIDTIVAAVGTLSDTGTKTWTAICDVDRNGQIDSADIALINAARNTAAGTSDPRDANKDGSINILDARQCTLKCTKANCAR